MNSYNVAIVGAGPGGIFAAYELKKQKPELSVVVIEKGSALHRRKCPIDGVKIKSCINCPSCSIMNGFGAPARSRMENTILLTNLEAISINT